MTAAEKEKVLSNWLRFLRNGLQRNDFTKALYNHLYQHCDFIAHYNIHGFASEYFETGDGKIRFLQQFDREQIRRQAHLGWKLRGTGADLTEAMIDEGAKYLPVLYAQANAEQKQSDLRRAEALLNRYGLKLAEAIKPVESTSIATTAAATQGNLFG